jgi:DNA invertase Pin-like site-specific DNA recombinase
LQSRPFSIAVRYNYETRRERQHQGVRLAKIAGKYAGRSPNTTTHNRIVALRTAGQTIKQTAVLTRCSLSQVKRIWAMHLATARPTEG